MVYVELGHHHGDEILWFAAWGQEGLWSPENVRVISFRQRKRWNEDRLRGHKGARYTLGDKEGE